MPQVVCPKCNNPREVSDVVYKRLLKDPKCCKSCAQKKRMESDEARKNISIALTDQPKSDEMKEKLKMYRLAHPETWEGRVATGAGGGWNKGKTLGPRSEETKDKISQSMMGKNKGKKLKHKTFKEYYNE